MDIHYLLLATTVQEVNVITFQADGRAHIEEVWPGDIVGLPDAKVETTGDGRHFEAPVISEAFQGKSLIQWGLIGIKIRSRRRSRARNCMPCRSRTACREPSFRYL